MPGLDGCTMLNDPVLLAVTGLFLEITKAADEFMQPSAGEGEAKQNCWAQKIQKGAKKTRDKPKQTEIPDPDVLLDKWLNRKENTKHLYGFFRQADLSEERGQGIIATARESIPELMYGVGRLGPVIQSKAMEAYQNSSLCADPRERKNGAHTCFVK